MRAIFAAAFVAGMLAAGSAQACRSSDYQQELLFSDMPPLEPRDTLVLEVEIRRVKGHYAWATVRDVREGDYSRRQVRIQVMSTSCGPFPYAGDRGLLVGRLEAAADGQPVFIPQLDSPGRRKERQKSRP